MNKVIKILMNREGYSEDGAREICREVKEMMQEELRNGNMAEAEKIFEEELGLEIDYIVGFLLM